MSWEEAWREERTGWDAGSAAPPLLDYLQEEGAAAPLKRHALVPGCGSGYDVFALAHYGYRTTGLDLAPTAAQRFEMLRGREGLERAQAEIITADFFEYEPESALDLIWDYTFLCALEPSSRSAWGEKMGALLKPGATLLTLLFPVRRPDDPTPVGEEEPGPPYRLHVEHARAALKDRFELIRCERPRRSHEGRADLEQLAEWRRIG